MNTVTVRWFDGYLETFEATEVRFGSDLLWMRLAPTADGNVYNRHIPMRQVRWFSLSKESHEINQKINQQTDVKIPDMYKFAYALADTYLDNEVPSEQIEAFVEKYVKELDS